MNDHDDFDELEPFDRDADTDEAMAPRAARRARNTRIAVRAAGGVAAGVGAREAVKHHRGALLAAVAAGAVALAVLPPERRRQVVKVVLVVVAVVAGFAAALVAVVMLAGLTTPDGDAVTVPATSVTRVPAPAGPSCEWGPLC